MAGEMIYMVSFILHHSDLKAYLDLGIESVLQSGELLPLATFNRLSWISKPSKISDVVTYFHEPIALL